GLVVVPSRGQGDAPLRQGGRRSGLSFQGLVAVREGLVVLPQLVERLRAGDVAVHVLRIQPKHLIVGGDGSGEVPLLVEHLAAVKSATARSSCPWPRKARPRP